MTTPKTESAAEPSFDIEKPACFYLGREYDLQADAPAKPTRPVMYDARDLTTHGVVVGMTGSGKTGLCLSLLEEAAIDGIPCIMIDPKGDLTNLLLQFPGLDPADYAKWLNAEDAQRKGLSKEEYAQELSQRTKEGLEATQQTVDRVKRCRDSSSWRIYTPGSEAGFPVSILRTFAAPEKGIPREALNERVNATASALLGLAGIQADPVQSREHILLSQLLVRAWTAGRDLDLTALIKQVQAPPMKEIGAFEMETFYPEKDRLKLAVTLNNILASPTFATWTMGEPLDLGGMIKDGDKPRQCIFYLAHLDDTQRMFFITLLLEEVLTWTRKQPGTTNLRAILYFDEVFGYLPPHPGNPPSKQPLMTLLKQARAFGVGVLLATQNPVDLDYKALSNAGTWFVGKLQTERDKARLIEGLQGVSAERGSLSDKNHLEAVIANLKNRVFLLNNVHQGKPSIFQTRYALSFLRGPLTRDQVAALMRPYKEEEAVDAILVCGECDAELPPDATVCPKCGARQTPPRVADQPFKDVMHDRVGAEAHAPGAADRPDLPGDLRQVFLPRTRRASGPVVYQPRLLAEATVAFLQRTKGVDHRIEYRLLAAPPGAGQPLSWAAAETLKVEPSEQPGEASGWGEVPGDWCAPRKMKPLQKDFAEHVYASARLRVHENKKLDLVSEPGEDPRDFEFRCQQAALRKADEEIDKERQRYLPKFQRAGIPMPAGDAATAAGKGSDWLSTIVMGASVLKSLTGKGPNLRGVKKGTDLLAEWRSKVATIQEKWQRFASEASEVLVTPRKSDVQVTAFQLAWAPYAETSTAEGQVLVPLYK